MNPQYPQQQYQLDAYSQNSAYEAQTQHWRRGLFIIVILVFVAWGVYTLVSAFITRQDTGVLVINPSMSSAVITAQQAGTDRATIGTGHTKVRLSPGTYTITATEGTKAASRLITIREQQQTNLALTLMDTVPMQHIAKYTAQYLFAASDNNLYFVNSLEGIPYIFQLGSEAARPYLSNINDITTLHWLSPLQTVYEASTGEWQYDTSTTSIPLVYGEETPSGQSVSTNQRGMLAFVATDNTVVRAEYAGGPIKVLGSAPSEQTQTSIAPNGDVLTFTPRRSISDPKEQTVLYSEGSSVKLPETLAGIIGVAWRDDSMAFSYTTTKGIFVYDHKTSTTTQVADITPTNTNAMLWVDDGTVVYAYNHAIWRHNLKTQTTDKLASIQGDLTVGQNLALSSDLKSIYFSTAADNNDEGGAIYSILHNYNSLSKAEQQAARSAQKQASQRTIRYIGLNELNNMGLSFDQTETTRYVIGSFASSVTTKPSIIRIKDPVLELKPGATDTIHFTMITDRGSYRADLDTTSITTIRLYVYDNQSGQLVYDSKPIDAQ